MKRFIAILCALLMTVSVFSYTAPQKAEAAMITTYVGDLYVTKMNNLWVEPTTNALMLVTPGNSLSGLYYDRVYAVYDSTKGGYVVQSKVATHVSSSAITVASNAIGLAMSYQPGGDNKEPEYARKNWEAWQQIRVGDVLKIGSGIDLTNKTCSTSGTWGTDFKSNAIIQVHTVRDDSLPKTAFTGKKIVALGDSVTAGGGWVDAIEERYNCEIINSGTPGDRTDEALARFDSVVAAHNPDLVFIKFCLNDCIQYTITTNTLPAFKNNLKTLYNKCRALGAEVVFMNTNNCKMSNWENSSRYSSVGGFIPYFNQFQASIGEVADELGCHFIDVYAQWKDKDYTNYLMDTVHPNAAGYERDKTAIFNYLDAHINEIFPAPANPNLVETNIGDLRIDKYSSIYTEPYNNTIAIVEGGTAMTNAYQHRIIAYYSAAKGGYVVQEKTAAYRQSTSSVPSGGIGLIFYYAPLVTLGSDLARENFAIWQQIRVGDVLKIKSGIDLDANTVSTSGSFGASDYTSNAKISVTTVRDKTAPKTAYSDKTIVAYGDSVTAGGGWTDALAEHFNTNIINAATPGYLSNDGVSTFDKHVAVHDPDIVLLMFGINDATQYSITTSTLTTFKNNMRTLYNKCIAIGAKPIFMTTNNIKVSTFAGYTDRYASVGGFEAYFPQYQQAVRDLANETGSECIDIYADWASVDYTTHLFDTVHPNSKGYDVMLATMKTYLTNNADRIASADPAAFTTKDGVTGITVADNVMYGVGIKNSVSSLVGSFKSTVVVLDAAGNQLADGDYVGTGCIIRNKFSNGTYVDATAVVIGDISGDGNLNALDYIALRNMIKEGADKDSVYAKAGDLSQDTFVNAVDYIALKNKLKGY